VERKVVYKGKVLTVFEWVGMPGQDVLSAAKAVGECFREFPYPMPPQPRLLFIARILSAYARAPFSVPADFDPEAFKRDPKVEEDIVGEFIRRRGLDYVDQLFRREKRKLEERRIVAEREARELAEKAAKDQPS
jgi:hypothetical protein